MSNTSNGFSVLLSIISSGGRSDASGCNRDRAIHGGNRDSVGGMEEMELWVMAAVGVVIVDYMHKKLPLAQKGYR